MIRRLSALRPAVAALFSVLVAMSGPGAARAECAGQNLFDAMPAEDSAAIQAAAAAVPYPEGNLWTAQKDGRTLTIVGTYHLDDPRHEATLTRLAPLVAAAPVLLVEAGPEEQKALKAHLGRDPSIMVIATGPTLAETLPPDTWARLKEALAARGIPAFMGAKLRAWYVTVLLSIPPCALAEMTEPKGLDGMLIDSALMAGVPVRALEPYDTVFTMFGAMAEKDQTAMIEQSLAVEDQISDVSVTLADSYFAGKSREMWELMRHQSYAVPGLSREEVDADMALLEQVLMTDRNRAWIPVIEAAAEEGPAVVAFGALHLSGETGVLKLLADRGWTIAPMDAP